ncbi:hypothetical protein [Ascidiimonas sp. W6]|uniref:hypothetical protein n=1 Tax=Ascidiimonas meishanensis TaxID=3128903 RepID=UPI0030EE0EA9
MEQVIIDNEAYFKIANSDHMRPFFMSIVSDSNHWMFISSNGGLTAGRKNSEYSFFPYYTDDKITESAEITGSKSIFQVNGKQLWEPFSIRQEGLYKTTRNLYKNIFGNKVIFEEINHDLSLTFRYQWSSSNEFGFVKKSTLVNNSSSNINVVLLDGFQNILPYGVPTDTQNRVSNLVDAYKRNQLEKEVGLGIYALSAIIVDKAEPSEALKANIAWSLGLKNPKYLVSSLQLQEFRSGNKIKEETDIKAEKGAYFVNVEIELASLAEKEWILVANVNQDHSAIASIIHQINQEKNLYEQVLENVELGTKRLIQLNGSSDGLQQTADNLRDTRHFSNTLFNIMRGGIFDNNYNIEKWDFKNYLSNANKTVFQSVEATIDSLPEIFSLTQLKNVANQSNDKNFRRLCLEYMPLKFSRRHGDPSRPWNIFSINTRSELDGSKILDYQGNWRDIFQNWEALALSFPEFVEAMIHKFLNATTFDGYNPYRVTKDGFDWETIEPDNPWSYIGYWGDHQIIYLLKFLEFIEKYTPGKLDSYFNEEIFVYANVPYKIKSYEDILNNPKDTIEFDEELDHHIAITKETLGADSALRFNKEGTIHQVNFIEKILATVLAKVSNFIPEAGIWLNTQRPEWNDANNALVGNGVSMVTLYYLRRFLNFFEKTLTDSNVKVVAVSEELMKFFQSIHATLETHQDLLNTTISDKDRKQILDGLGQAGSEYRLTIYDKKFTGNKNNLELQKVIQFLKLTLSYLDHTIDANRRKDNMYHAYNLMTLHGDHSVSISYLEEMLEGQVAALSSGYISSKDCMNLLDGLKNSALFREDQYSYLLYPNKELPSFLNKNSIPKEAIERSQLLKQLVKDGNNRIIEKDINGKYHFNGNFNNANSVKNALSKLDASQYKDLVDAEKSLILNIFEEVFNHKAFTGRSGTFYGYEGLGSIYWHMVSKLQLAVQECCIRAIEDKESDKVIGRLLEHYYEINEGIGVHKSPSLYGAFPTDPYSHTPSGKGAQQPGMTGQVKEDILSRFGELGVFLENGKLSFNPCLLRRNEFLSHPKMFEYLDVDANQKRLPLDANSLCFTYCQVPVIYKLADTESLEVIFSDEHHKQFDELQLDKETSEKVFKRTGLVSHIVVTLKERLINVAIER